MDQSTPQKGADDSLQASEGIQQSGSNTPLESTGNPGNGGRRYSSPVFSITVGETKSNFTAHASVLSRSPVLACMCYGPFVETANHHINLPDDDADIFGYFLDYLYTDYVPSHTTSSIDHGMKMANLYTLGDKYQLKCLKEIIIKEIDTDLSISADSNVFFPVMQKMFEGVTRIDEDFHNYFSKTATKALLNMNEVEFKNLEGLISGGDNLIRSLVNIQREVCQALKDSEAHWKGKYDEATTQKKEALEQIAILSTKSIKDGRRIGDLEGQLQHQRNLIEIKKPRVI